MPIPIELQLDALLRVALAGLLGGVVGVDREVRRKPAGVRTFAFVAMGAALFTVAGETAFPGPDSSARIVAQVVTGVGFLGAGVIVRQGDRSQVHGLTSAACAFFAACVGIVCGAGHWPIALTALALAFLLLTFGRRTERWLHHALGGKDYPHNSEAVPPQSSEAGPHQPGK